MEKIQEIVNQKKKKKSNGNAILLPRNRVSPSSMHTGCLLTSFLLDE